ncbi:hypothetical protein D9M71_612120 [compost metagenome]
MGDAFAQQPVGGVAGVLHRRGETPFRRKAVIHRQQREAPMGGQAAAQRVVGIQAADHVAAAMEVQQRRLGAGAQFRRAVEPRRQGPAIAGGDAQAGALDLFHRLVQGQGGHLEVSAGLLRGLFVHGPALAGQAAEFDQFEEGFEFGHDGHGVSLHGGAARAA